MVSYYSLLNNTSTNDTELIIKYDLLFSYFSYAASVLIMPSAKQY